MDRIELLRNIEDKVFTSDGCMVLFGEGSGVYIADKENKQVRVTGLSGYVYGTGGILCVFADYTTNDGFCDGLLVSTLSINEIEAIYNELFKEKQD